jgi:hypothetical protein
MLSCRLAVVADSVVRDADTNFVSIFNVYEEVNALGFPLALTKVVALFIVTRESTDAGHFDGRLRVTLDGVQLADFPIALDFQEKLITRVIARLHGFIIPAAGVLRTSLTVSQDDIGHWLTAVNRVPRAPGLELSNDR